MSATLSNVIRSGSQPSLKQITKGRDLFTWTRKQLERSHPRIAVDWDVVECVESLFQDICAGRTIDYPPIQWSIIFAEIRWNNIYDTTGHHCSFVLLEAVGFLCDMLIREGGRRVPYVRACELIHDYWGWKRPYIHYKDTPSGTFLISTPDCEREFGVRIKVKLTDLPMVDHDWTLRDCAD